MTPTPRNLRNLRVPVHCKNDFIHDSRRCFAASAEALRSFPMLRVSDVRVFQFAVLLPLIVTAVLVNFPRRKLQFRFASFIRGAREKRLVQIKNATIRKKRQRVRRYAQNICRIAKCAACHYPTEFLASACSMFHRSLHKR